MIRSSTAYIFYLQPCWPKNFNTRSFDLLHLLNDRQEQHLKTLRVKGQGV